jgi:hypothetical protein
MNAGLFVALAGGWMIACGLGTISPVIGGVAVMVMGICVLLALIVKDAPRQ